MRRFSDFADERDRGLDGEKMPFAEVLNHEIELIAYKLFPSTKVSGKECLQIQFKKDGQLRVAFTNSMVVIKQIEKYGENLPFLTTIKKNRSYYTLT